MYSAIARFGAALPGGGGAAVARRAFGRKAGALAADLPWGLERLASAVPPRSGVTASGLLVGHTLFPYMARFVEPRLSESLATWAFRGGSRPPQAGTLVNRLPRPGRLRACAGCVSEHRSTVGDARWLAWHQLPGVLVCAEHGTSLLETPVRGCALPSGPGCVPLGPDQLAGSSTPDVPHMALATRVALASRKLQEAPLRETGTLIASTALRSLLRAYAWSRAPSLLASADLVRDLLAHGGFTGVLALAGARIEEPGLLATALYRALNVNKPNMHPLLAIALLEFAGGRVDDLLDGPERPEPRVLRETVRVGPLPCANPVCGQFRGDPASSPGMPEVRARHACTECGFSYRWDPRGRSRVTVIRTGAVWEAELARLLGIESMSLRHISRRLHASLPAVSKRARAMGFTRDGWSDHPRLKFRGDIAAADRIARHRAAWVAYRQSGGAGPSKAFPPELRNAYRHLGKHDAVWLAANWPLVRTYRGRPASS